MTWSRIRVGLIAGLAGGLVLGLGGRIIMRILAIVAQTGAGFSVGGTIEVLLTGVFIGVPAALVFVFVRKHIPLPGLQRGVLFGVVLFLLLVLVPPPAARSASSGLTEVAPYTLGLFGVLFVVYGIVVEMVVGRCTP